jgi:hypothetical protein
MQAKANAIIILDMPASFRLPDLQRIVTKTHLQPFVGFTFYDEPSHTGHLLIQKPSYIPFVMFVLQKIAVECEVTFSPELFSAHRHPYFQALLGLTPPPASALSRMETPPQAIKSTRC